MGNFNKKNICKEFEYACDGMNAYTYKEVPISDCSTYEAGVCYLNYEEETNTLYVYLRRPGLLIGKQGQNIDKLKKHLDCKIYLHEIKVLASPKLLSLKEIDNVLKQFKTIKQ